MDNLVFSCVRNPQSLYMLLYWKNPKRGGPFQPQCGVLYAIFIFGFVFNSLICFQGCDEILEWLNMLMVEWCTPTSTPTLSNLTSSILQVIVTLALLSVMFSQYVLGLIHKNVLAQCYGSYLENMLATKFEFSCSLVMVFDCGLWSIEF